MTTPNHALVLGASGISGWALLSQCLTYPTPTTFSRITGTTNRPLTLSQAQLPTNDPRINLVNGVDLTRPSAEVKQLLKQKVHDVETVTHVFFTAYIAKDSFEELKEVNAKLLRNAIEAVTALAGGLKSVVLQTGGKHYGVEFADKLELRPPFHESTPRIPDPYAQNIFYYTQYDILSTLFSSQSSPQEQDQKWTFAEVRPDVIIGFVPGDNAMDCARGLAIYLTLWREVHGKGSKAPFPGTEESWRCRHTDSCQDLIARFEIFAALEPERCGGGESFNIADGDIVTWADKWPGLCAYFGLEGTGPESGMKKPSEFIAENKGKWDELVKRQGLSMNAAERYQAPFLNFVMVMFDFDRQYDLSKIRSVGFEERKDTVKGYTEAFERLKRGGIIPAS